MELADNLFVFQQTVSRDERDVTIYPSAVDTPRGTLLIDTGFPGTADQIEANLEEAGTSWQEVFGVVLTHQDTDHAGALREVVDAADPLVFAHPKSTPYIDGREHPIKAPADRRYPPVPVDIEVTEGATFRTAAGLMKVVFTPGHAPGHISLYLPEARLIVAGDALNAEGGRVTPPGEAFTLDMDEALDSVRTLAGFEFEQMLTYHGGLIDTDPAAVLEMVDT